MSLNARSLNNKMDDLKQAARIYKPHIIGVTETWGTIETNDAFYNIEDYILYRNDRLGRKGGGTMLYISNKLGQSNCRALNNPVHGIGYDSSVWCWVSPIKGKKILVGTIYRSPTSTVVNDNNMLRLFDDANTVAGDNRLLIMGDFNVPKINWAANEVLTGARRIDRELHARVTDNFLNQHVKIPTRYCGSMKSTLDLIFTKEEDVKNIEVTSPVGNSDHGVVLGDFICKWKSRAKPKSNRAYYKGNFNNIREKVRNISWVEDFENKSTEECIKHYIENINQIVEENIPLRQHKDFNEPWMNDNRMRLWRKKQNTWARVQRMGCRRNWRKYKAARDTLRKSMRKARRLYEKNISAKARHNKRAFFKYVNSRLTVRPEITAMKNSDGQLVEEDKEIAEAIIEYFNTVYTSHRGEEMPEMEMMTNQKLEKIDITTELVEKKLEKLNINKSCGPDGIHPHVLQKTAKAMSEPLTLIYQKSLEEGCCPEDWKTANVTPIHKKGDRTDPSNYRPVSLTSQVCKVLESIIRDKIVEHLDKYNLLNNSQHGFREGRSCLTNLLETLEQWTEIIDDGDCVDVAYLDFRKAFDLVSHEHLIYKLSKYGISGQILSWIKDFLKNRTQKVVIRGTESTTRNVTSGVPQGSVLGPILFLIYINDLPLNVISPLSLFADDSKLFSRIVTKKKKSKAEDRDGTIDLQNDLNKVVDWAKKWKMEFNVDKCKIMHLGHRNPGNIYKMNDTELTVTDEEKDLGVLIDNKLDFGKHIKNIVGRANRVLGMIRISFVCLNIPMFLNMYTALVRPLLEYCVQVWSPYKSKYIKLLEGVQRRATRLVPQLKKLPYDVRLEKLGLTRLEERRKRGDMIETYKLLSGKEKVDSNIFFTPATFRGRSHSKKLFKKYARLNVRKKFFSQRVVQHWNILAPREVEAKKTGDFKKAYDKNQALRLSEIRNRDYIYY